MDHSEEKNRVDTAVSIPQLTDGERGVKSVEARREFLKKLALMTGAAAAGGTIASTVFQGCGITTRSASSTWDGVKRRYGMVIDTKKCINCKSCTIACKSENATPPGVSYTVVLEERDKETGKLVFYSKPCFHCSVPSCVKVCPTGATYKRQEDGIVVVDYDRCIGCRYCISACPYGSRYMDYGDRYQVTDEPNKYDLPSVEYHEYRPTNGSDSTKGVVRKCNFCLHMQNEKGEYTDIPACVKTCVGKALHFGDFNDPNSDVSKLLEERQHIRLKEELGNEPNVYYLI